MAYFDPFAYWTATLQVPPSDADIRSYLEDEGLFDEPLYLTDTRMQADVIAAKQQATATGNTKLTNTLDFILKYGDKALAILSRNGIIKNQNLVSAGYSNVTDQLGRYATDKDTATSNAPTTENRVFNIDFTDPKVLIITFLILLILGYFLFLNPRNNAKR